MKEKPIKRFTKTVACSGYIHGNGEEETINIKMNLEKSPFSVIADGGDDSLICFWSDSRLPCRDIYEKIKNGVTEKDLLLFGLEKWN